MEEPKQTNGFKQLLSQVKDQLTYTKMHDVKTKLNDIKKNTDAPKVLINMQADFYRILQTEHKTTKVDAAVRSYVQEKLAFVRLIDKNHEYEWFRDNFLPKLNRKAHEFSTKRHIDARYFADFDTKYNALLAADDAKQKEVVSNGLFNTVMGMFNTGTVNSATDLFDRVNANYAKIDTTDADFKIRMQALALYYDELDLTMRLYSKQFDIDATDAVDYKYNQLWSEINELRQLDLSAEQNKQLNSLGQMFDHVDDFNFEALNFNNPDREQIQTELNNTTKKIKWAIFKDTPFSIPAQREQQKALRKAPLVVYPDQIVIMDIKHEQPQEFKEKSLMEVVNRLNRAINADTIKAETAMAINE